MTITMYGADWCGDCRRARAWFDANGVAYDYIDLVENHDETERVLERNNGVRRIPVIVFDDDSHLVEPTDDELAAKVAATAEARDSRPAVIENAHLGRFELLRRGEVVSFASYTEHDGSVLVPHVETLRPHRGNGLAAELMDGMLGILRNDGRTITPLCSFASQHIRDNAHHHDLVTRA